MFEWAFPWVLIAIPLPFLIWFCWPGIHVPIPLALKVPFFSAMETLVQAQKTDKMAFKPLLIPFLLWILLLVALAGPRYAGEPLATARNGYNIMLALDLSESMEIPDMILQGRATSRLYVVKQAAEEFVKNRSSDKIGLILFGERAYLQTPLTYDRNNVLQRIADATAGLAGKTTSIGDAIGLAVKRFQNVPSKERIIILLTDGANTSGTLKPLKAAELAKEEGIKIYTIGLGAEANPLALSAGLVVANADLDEDTLKKIAKLTQGRYFRATDTESLHDIYQTIDALEAVQQEAPPVRPKTEYYPWILACTFGLFILWILHLTHWQALFNRPTKGAS